MSAKTKIRNSILKLIVSEYQAIGIYQAEVFWNNYPQETFKVIFTLSGAISSIAYITALSLLSSGC